MISLLLWVPLIGMLAMTLLGHRVKAGRINVYVNAAMLAVSLVLAGQVWGNGPIESGDSMLRVDAFNVYLIVLTAFIGFTTSLFSAPYMENEQVHGRLTEGGLRLYHAMYQGFMLAMFLVLTANNMGLMWVAMEGATLATVLLVGLYRTPESIEAAWKYFIRHRAAVLRGRAAAECRRACPDLVLAVRTFSRAESRGADPRLRVPAGGLRHENGPRPDA